MFGGNKNVTQIIRKLCLSTKFSHHEFRWNYGILRNGIHTQNVKLSLYDHFDFGGTWQAPICGFYKHHLKIIPVLWFLGWWVDTVQHKKFIESKTVSNWITDSKNRPGGPLLNLGKESKSWNFVIKYLLTTLTISRKKFFWSGWFSFF